MANEIYETREEAEAVAAKLNSERVRDNFVYVASEDRDWFTPGHPLRGYSVGCCSND